MVMLYFLCVEMVLEDQENFWQKRFGRGMLLEIFDLPAALG